MEDNAFTESGLLKIKNETDRTTVATILFKNGYSVEPIKKRNKGKTYDYFVGYKYHTPKAEDS